MIKVSSKKEAFRFLERLYPDIKLEQDKKFSNTYYCSGSCPIAFIIDLDARLEINMVDNSSFIIWIFEEPQSFTIKVGLITEKPILPNVVINDVSEVIYYNVAGFTNEALEDGKMGVVFHFSDGESASFHINEIAYTLFE